MDFVISVNFLIKQLLHEEKFRTKIKYLENENTF